MSISGINSQVQTKEDKNTDSKNTVSKLDDFLVQKIKADANENTISDYLKGDINNDHKINDEDTLKLKDIINKKLDPSSDEFSAADLNDDGEVDSKDWSFMLKRLKGPKDLDFNYDGKIDESDIDLFEQYLKGTWLFTEAENTKADLNTQGGVTREDFDIFSDRFEERLFGDLNKDGKINKADYDKAVDAKNKKIILTEAELEATKSSESKDLTGFIKLLDKRLKERPKWDVTGDGKITQADVDKLKKYIEGELLLTDAEIKAGNVTGDGDEIDENDIKEFEKRLALRKAGDITGDGYMKPDDLQVLIDAKENNTLLTEVELKSVDINFDDKLTQEDIDALRLRFTPRTMTGDLSGNGQLDSKDVSILQSYISGSYIFTEAEKQAADINHDNKVTNKDLYLLAMLQEYIAGGLGDLVKDGTFDHKDVNVLDLYLKGQGSLSPEQLKAADMNQDGFITDKDLEILDKFVKEINNFDNDEDIEKVKNKSRHKKA